MKTTKLTSKYCITILLLFYSIGLAAQKGNSKKQSGNFKIHITESRNILENRYSALPKGLKCFNAKIELAGTNKEISKGKNSGVAREMGEITEYLNESFEDGFPGNIWQLIGTQGPNGQYYQWGITTEKACNGSYSVWCCKDTNDNNNTSTTYPPNCVTWLITKLPQAERNWTILNFMAYVDLGLGDKFYYMASVDSADFWGHCITSTLTDDWIPLSLNLKRVPGYGDMTSSSDIWVAFIFASAPIALPPGNHEGVYLDDITIHGAKLDTLAYADNQTPIVLPPDDHAAGLAFDGQSFWYSDWQANELVQLNSDWQFVDSIKLNYEGANGLVFANDVLWNVDWDTDFLYRFENEKPEPYHKTSGENPNGLTWDGHYLWYSDFMDTSLTRFEPDSKEELEFKINTAFPTRIAGIAYHQGIFFLSDWHNDLIYILDSGKKIQKTFLAPNKFPDGLEYAQNALWCVANDTIYKLDYNPTSSLNVNINRIDVSKFPGIKTYVTVLNENEVPILDLKQHNFVLNDERKPYTFDKFISALENQGADVVMALDYSNSMDSLSLNAMESAAKTYVDSMKETDKTAIIKFASRPEIFQPLTADTASLHQAIKKPVGFKRWATYLYDAIIMAIDVLVESSTPLRQRAIIVMADGDDSDTKTHLNEVISHADTNHIPIFTIGIGNKVSVDTLKKIAYSTGGNYYDSPTSSNLDSICQEISKQFSNQYSLFYNTDDIIHDGTDREVIVWVNNNNSAGCDTFFYRALGPRPIEVSIPKSLTGPPECTIYVPVNISDVSHIEVNSVCLSVSFDPAILNFSDVSTRGTLTDGWHLFYNNVTSGQINLAIAGDSALADAGTTLVDIVFKVKGVTHQTCELCPKDIVFNEGLPVATTSNGLFTVSDKCRITGKISYYSNSKPVNAVSLILENIHPDTAISDINGKYLLDSLPADSFAICPARTGGLNNSISALDAARVFQFVSAKQTFSLSLLQMIAADVNGDSSITNDDGIDILKFCLGSIDTFTIGDDWSFVPCNFLIDSTNWASAPKCLCYPALNKNMIDQDFSAIVYGDVTGNWRPLTVQFDKQQHNNLLDTQLITDDIGEDMTNFTIGVNNVSNVYSFGLIINYAPQMLKILDVSAIDLAKECKLIYCIENKEIRIAAAGAKPIKDSGSIIKVEFKLLKNAALNGIEPFTITQFSLNEVQTANLNRLIPFQQDRQLPTEYGLSQNFPNPFNLQTKIKYQLPEKARVKLEIINVLGRRVRMLVDEEKEAGYHNVIWDGQNDSRQIVSSGLYFCRLYAEDFMKIRKIVLFK